MQSPGFRNGNPIRFGIPHFDVKAATAVDGKQAAKLSSSFSSGRISCLGGTS
jgi:hypothetical protein